MPEPNDEHQFSARGVSSAPPSPGVYAVVGRNGGVLYVGESENMREALMKHFRDQGGQGPFMAHDELCYLCQQMSEQAAAQGTCERTHPPLASARQSVDDSRVARRAARPTSSLLLPRSVSVLAGDLSRWRSQSRSDIKGSQSGIRNMLFRGAAVMTLHPIADRSATGRSCPCCRAEGGARKR